jgi:hypothetical protein
MKRLKYLAALNQEALPQDTDPTLERVYVDISGVDGLGRITEREQRPPGRGGFGCRVRIVCERSSRTSFERAARLPQAGPCRCQVAARRRQVGVALANRQVDIRDTQSSDERDSQK